MCWCPHWAGVKAQLCWKVWERREDSLLHGVEWSCILAPRTARGARSLSSARRQPAQLKQCSAGHHTCNECITIFYNIQRFSLWKLSTFQWKVLRFPWSNMLPNMAYMSAGDFVCHWVVQFHPAPHLSIWISTASSHTAPHFSIYSSKFLYLNI